MIASASLPCAATASAADGPFPSVSAFASDGAGRLAPIGATWRSPDLRIAYDSMMAAALQLGHAHEGFSPAVTLLEQIWAADFHFRDQTGA